MYMYNPLEHTRKNRKINWQAQYSVCTSHPDKTRARQETGKFPVALSSCHTFSMGFKSGDSAGVRHQLILLSNVYMYAWVDRDTCFGSVPAWAYASGSTQEFVFKINNYTHVQCTMIPLLWMHKSSFALWQICEPVPLWICLTRHRFSPMFDMDPSTNWIVNYPLVISFSSPG